MENVILKSEDKRSRSEIVKFLQDIALKIDSGVVELVQGDQRVKLTIPELLTLELKVEEKIKANKPTIVGFMAKISQKKMQHYKSINIKPIIVTYAPEKITMYGIGGGQAVLPVNGEIILEVKNNANENILVDIFKGE